MCSSSHVRVTHEAEPVFRCKYNPLVDACGSGEENLVAAILDHDSSSLNKADQVRKSSYPSIYSQWTKDLKIRLAVKF